MEVSISGDFGFVALVVVISFVQNMYMTFNVVKARKKYNVQYPALYAVESENKQAKEFNCVQRGHQNYLEFMPFFLSNLILGGIKGVSKLKFSWMILCPRAIVTVASLRTPPVTVDTSGGVRGKQAPMSQEAKIRLWTTSRVQNCPPGLHAPVTLIIMLNFNRFRQVYKDSKKIWSSMFSTL